MSIQITYCRMALCLALAAPLVPSHAQQKAKKPSPQAAAKAKAEQLNVALFKAIAKRDVEEMERLIKRGANVNARNVRGMYTWGTFHGLAGKTPLMMAIEAKSLSAAQLLISRGANVNALAAASYLPEKGDAPFHGSITALDLAAVFNQPKIIELLVKSKAKLPQGDVEDYDSFAPQNALVLAARFNSLQAARALIDAGLTPRKPGVGYTSLSTANAGNYVQMVELLASSGASNEACTQVLLEAVNHQNFEIATALLKSGADPKVKDFSGNPVLVLLADAYKLQFSADQLISLFAGGIRNAQTEATAQGMVADYAELNRKRSALAKELIAKGANPDELSVGGYTALLLSIEKQDSTFVQALLENGANPNFAPSSLPSPLRFLAYNVNSSALQNAFPKAKATQASPSQEGADMMMARLLIKHGADPKVGDNRYALADAALHANSALVRFLLSAGSDPNISVPAQRYYITPVQRGITSKAQEFVQQERELNARPKNEAARAQISVLHMAAVRGELDIVQQLLAVGANSQVVDSYGDNPLHFLAQSGRTSTIYLQEMDAATIEGNKRDVGLMEYDIVEPLPAPEMIRLTQWANSGDTAVAQALLKAGCPANVPNKKGKTALDAAIPSAVPDVIEAMLQTGAEPSKTNALFDLINFGRRQRRTNAALTKLQLDLTEWDRIDLWYTDELKDLQLKSKQEARQNRLRSLAQRAQILRTWGTVDARVAALLLKNKVDVNARNSTGLTPLMAAARAGQIEVVQELIRARADVNAVNRSGETVLMQVIRYGGRSIKAMPVKQRISKDERSETWLTHSVTQRREVLIRQVLGKDDAAMIQLLMKSGAKTDTRNKAGLTALAIARQVRHPEAIAALTASNK